MKEAFPVVATESVEFPKESRSDVNPAELAVEAAFAIILGDSTVAPESYVYNYDGGRGAE